MSSQVARHRRSIVPSALRQICRQEEESIEHLLFFCDHARATWFASVLNYVPERQCFRSFNGRWVGILKLVKESGYDKLPSDAAHICWQTWKARNSMLKQNEPIQPIQSANRARRIASEFDKAKPFFSNNPSVPSSGIPIPTFWVAPS